MRQAEKEQKKFQSRILLKLDPGMKIPKKIAKKIKKASFWLYFQPKRDVIGREREKKNQFQIPFTLNPGKKIPKKIAKKIKKLKNLIPALFLSKKG